MMRLIALLPLLLLISACRMEEPPKACMDGRVRALTEGEFSGPILCDDEGASFVLAGRTSDGVYSIYDYRYRFRPLHGAVDHGGQRVLVFRDGAYLGQYTASPPPYTIVSVEGSVVKFDDPEANSPAYLDFSQGPPPQALISGNRTTFFR